MRAALRGLKRGAVDLYWSLRGPRLQFPAVPDKVGSVLFVCKGNICRSPFAEYAAKKLSRDAASGEILFASAGLHVSRPKASPPEAVRAARQFSIDLDRHRSQAVTDDLMVGMDMVVAMEIWQWEELGARFPQHGHKFFVLPLLGIHFRESRRGYSAFNIEDPYGRSLDAFERCFVTIERCVGELLTRIRGPR